MNTIDIGIPAGFNSELYIDLLVRSCEKTKSEESEFNYILGVNDKRVDVNFFERMFQSLEIKNYKVVVKYHDKSGISDGHGKCLDLIMSNMESKYGVFLDSDVVLLSKGWEKLLLNELDSKHIMIGSEYHRRDGKIVKFPNVITCMFDVDKFKELEISFVPHLKKIKPVGKDAEYYGVKPGQVVFLDTGCHIAKEIRKKNLDGKILDIVSPRYPDTESSLKFMKIGMRGEEYQLRGIPISTHVGRSSSRSFKNDQNVIIWRKRIEEWFNGKV